MCEGHAHKETLPVSAVNTATVCPVPQRTYGRVIYGRKFSARAMGAGQPVAELEIMDGKVTKTPERNFHECTIE